MKNITSKIIQIEQAINNRLCKEIRKKDMGKVDRCEKTNTAEQNLPDKKIMKIE